MEEVNDTDDLGNLTTAAAAPPVMILDLLDAGMADMNETNDTDKNPSTKWRSNSAVGILWLVIMAILCLTMTTCYCLVGSVLMAKGLTLESLIVCGRGERGAGLNKRK